jgi:hypothetical protein
MGDRSLRHYQKFVSNLTSDNIVKRSIVTPLDHARNMPNSMVGGDVHGVAPYFYQIGGHRPTPDLAQYTVPGVERFIWWARSCIRAAACTARAAATAIRMFEPARLLLAQAHGADRRMAEYHRGNIVVIKFSLGLAAEQAIGQAPAGGDGHRRQARMLRDIADGVQMFEAGALELVGQHVTAGIQRYPERIQSHAERGRRAADGPDHAVEWARSHGRRRA